MTGVGSPKIVNSGTGGPIAAGNLSVVAGGYLEGAGAPGQFIGINPNGSLYADLSTATAATINAIRVAFQVQKLLERDARGGTRYTEIILFNNFISSFNSSSFTFTKFFITFIRFFKSRYSRKLWSIFIN